MNGPEDEFDRMIRAFFRMLVVWWIVDVGCWVLTFTVDGDVANPAIAMGFIALIMTAFVVPAYIEIRRRR